MVTVAEKAIEKALDKVSRGFPVRSVAKEYGIPKSTLHDRVKKLKIKPKKLNLPKTFGQLKSDKPLILSGDINLGSKPGSFDDRFQQMLKYIGKSNNKLSFEPFSPKKGRKDGFEYKLVATDWHSPMHDKEKMHKAIEMFHAEFGPGGTLIIGGDFSDGYNLSSHGKLRVLPFDQEMAEARLLLEWLVSKFERVVVVDDNHIKDRWQRKKSQEIPPDYHFLVDDPYSWMVRGIPNVELARRTYKCYKNPEGLGWFHIEGDCLIAHMTRSGKPIMKPAQNLYEWYEAWRKRLGLPELRAFMEAHVHKLGGPYHLPGRDAALYETGCLASDEALEYGLGSEGKSTPAERGVIFLVQQNGRTDKNKTRVVHLEEY